MSLKDIEIKFEYRSLIDNIAKDFYIPLLNESISYKRAVGFFSSSSLIEISKGISGLIRNGGKIKVLASPNLSEEDINAIRKGYKKREEVIKNSLIKELKDPINEYQKNKLNYLSNLIESQLLDIKIVVTKTNNIIAGMYHEKVGIIEDSSGNKIAFSGSMNESANAFFSNYETIDVFKSWTDDSDRVIKKEEAFDSIWSNIEPSVETYEFKDITDTFIKKYKTKNIDCKNYIDNSIEKDVSFFKVPEDVHFYSYQEDAIKTWFENKCCGIYDMATGSGKTYTALGSIAKLSQKLDEKLAVIIVVPYIHLVQQWVEDINKFNVKPIVAHSDQDGINWKKKFDTAIQCYNLGIKKNFCIITTVASFTTQDFQNNIDKLKKDFCIVADEAHNLGASKNKEMLPKKAKYRLALSATIERHRDPEGTEMLRKYFGKTCISFSLKDAINKNFLTSYYYYPVPVHLNEEELDKYKEYTKQINKLQQYTNIDDERIQVLLIKRARIIAGCKEKINKIVEVLEPFKNDGHILVYCGATKYDYKQLDDTEEIRQIQEVTKRIGCKLNMRVRKFTSSESNEERKEIKELFSNGTIQVITAIKCLDEGVNIPAINRAFILASSTNPKEYIQRRGRVLRKYKGKEYAEIYDFITLPRPLDSVQFCNDKEKKLELSLLKNEFIRMKDFANTSRNPQEIDMLKQKILSVYELENNI